MSDESINQTEKNKEAVRKMYGAAKEADIAFIIALMDPEVEIVRAPGHPVGGTFRGMAAAGEARRRTNELTGTEGVEIKQVIAEGPDKVLGIMELKGTDATGQPWSMPSVEIVHFVDGKIVKIELFTDTATLHDIAGRK